MTFASMIQSLEGRVEVIERHGDYGVSVGAITDDSRSVPEGSLFVAVKGEHVDGHQFIPATMRAGIAALVSE